MSGSGRHSPVSPGERLVTRRRFLETATQAAVFLGAAGAGLASPAWLRSLVDEALASDAATQLMHDAPVARYWLSSNSAGVNCLLCHRSDEGLTDDRFTHDKAAVKCTLCAQSCTIRAGERGRCRSRANVNGELRSLVYGRPAAVHIDPIEKKPFYHFLPGSAAFSMATTGCPLSCRFCQNWELSQAKPEDYDVEYRTPDTIVAAAKNRGAPVIAYTYNEPTVFMEYFTDIARIAKKRGISSVLVSCGFMQEEPLEEMCDVLDAIKIDLKGFSPDFYRKVCSAELAPVLRSIKQVAASGIHLEIVNLVVPTLNDSEHMLTELVKWVVGELGPDVPVHFTRFHPDYQLRNLPPTPVATLERGYDIAKKGGMHFPFVGNVPGHEGNNTYCPGCGEIAIARTGFLVEENRIVDGRCGHCAGPIAGVWTKPR